MRLSQQDIIYMVSESVNKILSESVSRITYHFTDLRRCVNILKKDMMYLTMSSNGADAKDNKRLFYLSTQRSRTKDLGYAGHLGSCVRIQLNGDKLNNNFKGKPIDYWGGSMGKQSYYRDNSSDIYGRGLTRSRQTHHNFEMEDRVFSYEPMIPEFSQYILRLDVYIDMQTERRENTQNEKIIQQIDDRVFEDKNVAALIWSLGQRYKISVNVYSTLKDFNYMTNNTINDEMKELYYNSYENSKTDYRDALPHKTHEYFMDENKKLNVLRELFNVLTLGDIYRSDNKQQIIATTLKKYGLEKYTNKLSKDMNGRWGNSFEESCGLLSNTCNAPIRKLNSETDDDDALRIMKFGADILKKYGANSFDNLRNKLRN